MIYGGFSLENNNKTSLMLIDGMALLFRAFYATAVSGQFMINSKGMPTNGVHGFVKHLMTAITAFKPTHAAVCWDMGSKTFRTEMFDSYKANRPQAPIELIPQFELVKEVVAALDVPNIGLAGYEADDCIGTIARTANEVGSISILTGDKDILQLIDERVSVILLQKGYGNYLVHNRESLFAEKGIWPEQMIDLKAFMGDPSDNYPGVRGIGEKTALKLLQEHGDVDGVIANLHQLTKSQHAKIEDDLEMLHLSRQLAEIKCDVPVECRMDEAIFRIDREKVIAKFNEVELKGLHRLFENETSYV